jgi:hypothetical protein
LFAPGQATIIIINLGKNYSGALTAMSKNSSIANKSASLFAAKILIQMVIFCSCGCSFRGFVVFLEFTSKNQESI